MPATTSKGISLANKCQMLFGLAVLLILTAALSVPWVRMRHMVHHEQLEIARQLADAWLANIIQLGPLPDADFPENEFTPPGLRFHVITINEVELLVEQKPDALITDALTRFRDQSNNEPLFRSHDLPNSSFVRYRYIHPLFASDMVSIRDPLFARFDPAQPDPEIANPLWGILIVEHQALNATRQLIINRAYLILSGILAGLVAVLVFYFITNRLILAPVRILRETAERVSKGDLNIRSGISTGDEFEELSEAFNLMLSNLKGSQDQLRQVNKTLDLKLTELSESNVILEEASRLKSEFLANISHELRTPLNSILGFAEVLHDATPPENEDPETRQKRERYLHNILTSGQSLLNLINDLLDLAKIEAGRMDLNPEPISVSDVCDSLATLINPQAEKKSITVQVRVNPNLPLLETDPVRFQQVLFNFLSNAVKFTPENGTVTLAAERVRDPDINEAISVSVTDTGHGLSEEDQEFIFEKFRQIDAGHTRQHTGTGLGLAISKELTNLLGGRIELISEPGEGATFRIILPREIKQEQPQSLMPS